RRLQRRRQRRGRIPRRAAVRGNPGLRRTGDAAARALPRQRRGRALMGFTLIPGDDRELARRLRRQPMGGASYLMFLLPMAYAMVNGWMDFDAGGMALAFAVALAVNVVFFVLIRSGVTAHLRDPSLTFAQIAFAMAMALVIVHYANEARSILL